MTAMNPFQPATVTSAFLKMGIMGKQGAGKSKTAAKVTIGLVNHLKAKGIAYANKPVAFFDTETGSDWLIPDFEAAKIPLVVAKKKSFADLLAGVRWAEGNASALIIDSITHPWRELLESYMKKKQRSFLQIDDWSYLKGDHGWAQFTNLYVNSNLHIVMCGRAGDEMEQYTDENGKRQLEKIGTKMKTETETGFEPSLLVLMEREMNQRTNAVSHRAYVMKDRSTKLDGSEFDDPGFEDFLPHIAMLNLGGNHLGVDGSTDSQHMLTAEKRDWQPVQRDIVIEEIDDLLTRNGFGGSATANKQKRIELLLKHLKTSSKTEIEKAMPLFDLRAGYDSLHRELEGKPSRYGPAVQSYAAPATAIASTTTAQAINDSLPDHSAPAATADEPAEQEPKPAAKKGATRERLLADIPHLASVQDCLHWGLEMSGTAETLDKKDREMVRNALVARQAQIMNGAGISA